MKRRLIALLLSFCLLSVPLITHADSAPGDVIITLGENLSEQQKTALLSEMGDHEDPLIVYVTNQEEHKYLGDYISKAQIGSKALSSSRIIIGEKDSGLQVTTRNITWVSEDMYANALSTAGVKDAEVYVTAPFPVSGTAALTGILKAYETTMNIEIPEEQKQVANEEMVKTAQLSESIGDEKAVQFMNEVKREIAKHQPRSTEDIRALLQRVAERLGIQLTDADLDGLVGLFDKMRNIDINWQQVGKNLELAKNRLNEVMQQEETKNFLASLGDFFRKLIELINSWIN